MRTAKLSRLQARRFFKLIDPLTRYANDELEVVDPQKLEAVLQSRIDDGSQAAVLFELWDDPDTFEAFLRENPARLTSSELDVIRTWGDMLYGVFTVARFPDGVVRFMYDDFAFEVCGISDEVGTLLPSVPCHVLTKLVPFDDVIVFAEAMAVVSIDPRGPEAREIQREALRLNGEGVIVSNAQAYETAGRLLELDRIRSEIARLDERIAEFNAQIEELGKSVESDDINSDAADADERSTASGVDMTSCNGKASAGGATDASAAAGTNSADDGEGAGIVSSVGEREAGAPGSPASASASMNASIKASGQHVGALAGLSEAERKRAISEHNREEFGDGEPVVEFLKQRCHSGLATKSLEELLELEMIERLRITARRIGIDNFDALEKPVLVQALVATFGKKETLESCLDLLGTADLKFLRKVVNSGGVMLVTEDGAASLTQAPPLVPGLCSGFYHEEVFSFIIPDGVYEMCRELDWDDIIAVSEDLDNLYLVAEFVTELRGVVTADDILAEYERLYPSRPISRDKAVAEIVFCASFADARFRALESGGTLYLLHYQLAWLRDLDLSRPSDYEIIADFSSAEKGPLGESVEGILRAQGKMKPRPLSDGMMAKGDLYLWKAEQSSFKNLHDYLDAHVPDGCDDYRFADDAMDTLVDMTMWNAKGDPLRLYLNVLRDKGFTPAEGEEKTVAGLLVSLANNLPTWRNNGWSPLDRTEAIEGRRSFLNEDGTRMKVGRNDPCPCGSGKKYKKCCGR